MLYAILLKRFPSERAKRTRPSLSGLRLHRLIIQPGTYTRPTLELPASHLYVLCGLFFCRKRLSMAYNGCRWNAPVTSQGSSRRTSRSPRQRPVQMEASEFKLRLGPPFDQDRHSFYNYIIDCILSQALQSNPRVQVGTNIYESGPAYADDIVVLSNSYREMLDLREAVTHHTTTVASKTKVFITYS